MGGATGEAFVNTLYGTGMKPAVVLAREAIQNSVDATHSGSHDKVKVIFRRVSLTGKLKSAFIKSLALDTEFVSRKKELEIQKGNCIDSLKDADEPLRLLYIEDFGTPRTIWGAQRFEFPLLSVVAFTW